MRESRAAALVFPENPGSSCAPRSVWPAAGPALLEWESEWLGGRPSCTLHAGLRLMDWRWTCAPAVPAVCAPLAQAPSARPALRGRLSPTLGRRGGVLGMSGAGRVRGGQ